MDTVTAWQLSQLALIISLCIGLVKRSDINQEKERLNSNTRIDGLHKEYVGLLVKLLEQQAQDSNRKSSVLESLVDEFKAIKHEVINLADYGCEHRRNERRGNRAPKDPPSAPMSAQA